MPINQAPLIDSLPPFAEKHPIVAKVDTVMALCHRLEVAPTISDTTCTYLVVTPFPKAPDSVATPAKEAAE